MVTLSWLPAGPGGVLAVMLPLLTTVTLLPWSCRTENSTVAPLRKLELEMVTAVPPAAGPLFGLTPVTAGPEDGCTRRKETSPSGSNRAKAQHNSWAAEESQEGPILDLLKSAVYQQAGQRRCLSE
jgi:hypothetical protein